MTQNYTVDELREMAKRGETFRPGHTRGDIATAYADTLSKPADIGRVDANCMDVLRRLRDMLPTVGICGWPAGVSALDEAISTLAAQGQGEAVEWQYQGRDGVWRSFISDKHRHDTEADGSWPIRPLYTATAASTAGVPDVYAEHGEKALTHISNALDDLCDSPDQRAVPQLREAVHHIKAMIAAAPSAPEGGHIDRARFEKAPCYLCGYNGPGYYQPGTHSCAAKYHATQPKGE